MFRQATVEAAALRSQTVISNVGRGGRRYLPYAFTEHGVAMLSSVLRSQRAIRPMPTLNEVPEVAKLLATILTGDPVTHAHLGDAGAVAGVIKREPVPLGPTRDPGGDP